MVGGRRQPRRPGYVTGIPLQLLRPALVTNSLFQWAPLLPTRLFVIWYESRLTHYFITPALP